MRLFQKAGVLISELKDAETAAYLVNVVSQAVQLDDSSSTSSDTTNSSYDEVSLSPEREGHLANIVSKAIAERRKTVMPVPRNEEDSDTWEDLLNQHFTDGPASIGESPSGSRHNSITYEPKDAQLYLQEKLQSISKRDLDRLIILQKANGSWSSDQQLSSVLNVTIEQLIGSVPNAVKKKGAHVAEIIWATSVAVSYLETYCTGEQVEWEILAEKARKYLKKELVKIGSKSADMMSSAIQFIKQNVTVAQS